LELEFEGLRRIVDHRFGAKDCSGIIQALHKTESFDKHCSLIGRQRAITNATSCNTYANEDDRQGEDEEITRFHFEERHLVRRSASAA